jgi:hypothetical protein
MNKRALHMLAILVTAITPSISFNQKNNPLKPALNILEQCIKEEQDPANLPEVFNKKIAALFAKKKLPKLIKLLSEAEKLDNIYIMNGIAFTIAKKLSHPISGHQLIFLREKLSSLGYALVLSHAKNESLHSTNSTRGCSGTPISIAEYVSLYDTPILYLGDVGILLFNDKNISSLNGIQDISNADIVYTLLNDNCIAGYNDDPNFPTDPFQGIPNTRSLIADNNLIESLPATFLTSTPSIQEIYLGNNLLTLLPQGLFSNLDELALLDLSYNLLTTLTTTDILNLAALNILFLDNNSLVDIPADLIDGNANLRYLYLNNNVLASWPSTALNNVVDSMYLDLSYNNLTDFEPESITDGTEIILTGNSLTQSQQDFLVASFPNVYFTF